MSSSWNRRVLELFEDTVRLPPERRPEHLAIRAGADDDLRAEVASLLHWNDHRGGILDEPITDIVPESPELLATLDHETRPLRIGPYRIESTLGTGGMGVVYLAQQEQPVQRPVALKVIRRAVDSEEVRRRFVFEQQVTASLSHPNIATVYDAGLTADGCPFFAMEYVSGTPIVDFCDLHELTVRERIRLVIRVCGAVHHAHQKGIIHRDIKASNILVAETDTGPQPKVIDFGVALAEADGSPGGDRPVTRHPGMVGTLETMSPEQLGAGSSSVDIRADVYSLGVVLFELVCGTQPHRFSDEDDFASVCRTLCDSPAPKLIDAYLALEPAEKHRIAGARFTDERRMKALCRTELSSIAAKALRKDRELRYDGIPDLSEDLRRWLDNRPVRAHPRRLGYRAKKLLVRHRVAGSALLVACAAMVIGAAVATRAFVDAHQSRRRAAALLTDYRSLADGALLEELRAEADALWPAWPQRIEPMERWVLEARALTARREQHAARLRESSWDGLASGESGAMQQRLAEIERVLQSFDAHASDAVDLSDKELASRLEFLDAKRAQVVRERDRLLLELSTESEPRNRLQADPWLAQQLTDLIRTLDAFEEQYLGDDSPDSVANRIDRAHRAGTELEARSSRWKEAAEAIADPARHPEYQGLRLPPQHGLVPLRPDPNTNLWEFLVDDLGERPQPLASGGYAMDGESGVIMVLLPGGSFMMGAQADDTTRPNYDPRAWQHEGPVHVVSLAPFFISKYELTRGQWNRLAHSDPNTVTPIASNLEPSMRARDELPVDHVYWQQSRAALRRAGLLLPTEAQWEYAARGGRGGPWPSGDLDASLSRIANLRDRAKMRVDLARNRRQLTARYNEALDDGFAQLAPVGSFLANPFGLHDMFGNASEWCADWFQVYYCPVTPHSGLRIPADRGPKLRVLRGGHFDSLPEGARVTSRIHINPHVAGAGIGLRPVRPIIRDHDLTCFEW